jgi:hypothetical protein
MFPKSVSATSGVEQENKGDGMGGSTWFPASEQPAPAAPFADAAERSVPVSKTGERQSGLRTERVTLEVTHDSHLSLRDWPSLRTFFGESVRVVDGDITDNEIALTVERDAAIREREELKARVAELEAAVNSSAILTSSQAASGGGEGDVSKVAGLAFDAGFGASREGFNGECAFDHLAPEKSTFEGEPGTAYERLRNDSVAAILSSTASNGGGLKPHAWGVVLELHDAASAFRGWAGNVHQVRLDKAIAAAERLLTQPRPAVPASGGGEGDGTFFGAGGPFNFQYAEDSFFPPNVHGFLRQCVKIKDAPPQPRGWLSEEERGSIQHAATCAKSIWSYSLAQELENILARSSPPEVVWPKLQETGIFSNEVRDAEWIAALAAAGVAVKGVS